MNSPSNPPADELATIIRAGIEERGYYVASGERLDLLWAGEPLSSTEKLMRLHTFATERGWHATGRSECQTALFQSELQGPVSAASWRLDGDVERALGGRFSGSRE